MAIMMACPYVNMALEMILNTKKSLNSMNRNYRTRLKMKSIIRVHISIFMSDIFLIHANPPLRPCMVNMAYDKII